MGFPVVGCCPDLTLPPFLIYLVLFLGYLRRAVAWALSAVGLGDLVDTDEFLGDPTGHGPTPDVFQPAAAATPLHSYAHPRPRSLSATLIREALPCSSYDPPTQLQDCSDPESCAVCLHELESGDQVRQLGGCRHVFHACCIDPWVDLGRRTCPLCRAPLVPEELRESLSLLLPGSELWRDAASIPGSLASYSYVAGGELYLADDGDYYPTPQDDVGDYFLDENSLGLPPLEHSLDTGFLSWPTLQDNVAAASSHL